MYLIGICGGSGSGKTSLSKGLSQALGSQSLLISMDDYYLPIDRQQKDDNGIVNFDLLSALDLSQFIHDLNELKKGNAIQIRTYHFNNPKHQSKRIILAPREYIIVEGIFLLEALKSHKLLDFSIFVDCDKQVMFERRSIRDKTERCIDAELISYQWNNHFLPAYHQYILPHRDLASIRLSGELPFDYEYILNQIKSALDIKAL